MRIRMTLISSASFIAMWLLFVNLQCRTDAPLNPDNGNKVIIVIMDGARYTETWGDPEKKYIPYLATEMAPLGKIHTSFYNDGPTYTLASHTSLTTGNYQEINNSGLEYPQYASVFQHFNKSVEGNSSLIVSSKDKLGILADCLESDWSGTYNPSSNCGIDGGGPGSGYRDDSTTCAVALQLMANDHPRLVLINFKEPDFSGHSGHWQAYTNGIEATDKYAWMVWNFIRNDHFYQGSTTFILTTDHGRHSDGVLDGFASHGDTCQGCRHLFFYAYGPYIKAGVIDDVKRDLTDLAATAAHLVGTQLPHGQGVVMQELFE